MTVSLPADRPRVEVSLDDGSEALLSPLLPEDRDLLREGLDHLSVEGRFARFGQGRSGLSEHELDYLSNVDQVSHVAWGAIVEGEPAGVARYISSTDGDTAEVAVTVTDEFQRRGLGRALFGALVAVARADGIHSLIFEVVSSNTAVMQIISGMDAGLHRDGDLLAGEVVLGSLPRSPLEGELVTVMKQVRSEARRRPQSDSSSSSDAELMQ